MGYAGLRLERFLELLTERQMAVLLDVRQAAWSQNPAYCQETLRRAVEGHGIAYRHRPELGVPPAVRAQLQQHGDWTAFICTYAEVLAVHGPLLEQIGEPMPARIGCVCSAAHAIRPSASCPEQKT